MMWWTAMWKDRGVMCTYIHTHIPNVHLGLFDVDLHKELFTLSVLDSLLQL